MDAIEFGTVMEIDLVTERERIPTIHPIINGIQLREIARAVELPFAQAEGSPDLAGSYKGLNDVRHAGFPWAPDHFLVDGRVILLGCTCGDVGCWPLSAQVEISDSTVVWRDFGMPFRSWDHSSIGPFVFDKARYVEALERAVRGEAS